MKREHHYYDYGYDNGCIYIYEITRKSRPEYFMYPASLGLKKRTKRQLKKHLVRYGKVSSYREANRIFQKIVHYPDEE